MDGRATRAGLGLLIFFASLPLQWQVLAVTPFGVVRWFHLGALVLLILAPPTRAGLQRITRQARPLPVALAIMTGLLLVAAVAYRTAWTQSLQHLIYAVVGLSIGATLLTALSTERGQRLAAWSGPVALASFGISFGQTLAAAGMGPASVVSATLGDNPSAALITFFRVAFRSVSEAEAVNIRHEMFAALLVATYASLIARPQQPFQRFVVALTTVVVAGLMILSLSRAVTLAAFLPLLIALVRLFVRGRVTAPVIVLTGLGLAATPWLLPPAWRLLESRFLEDTGSYEARLGALSDLTLGDVGLRLFLGGGDLILSTHTMIFDAALRGGLLAGLAAAVVVFVFFRHTGRALLAYFATAQVAALAATGAGCLVLVRAFTGGSGLLHLVEWSAFGLVLAAAILRSPGAPHPRAVPAQVPGSDPYPGTGPTAVPAREQANDAAPARS